MPQFFIPPGRCIERFRHVFSPTGTWEPAPDRRKGSSDALTGVSTLSSPSLPTGLFARQEAGDRKLVHSNVPTPPAPDAQPATSTPPSGARSSQARDCWPHSPWIGCTTTPTASPSTAPLARRLGRGQTRQKSCMPAPRKTANLDLRIYLSETLTSGFYVPINGGFIALVSDRHVRAA